MHVSARIAVFLLSTSGCLAQSPPPVRVWGSAQVQDLVERWQRGFTRHHPEVRFENHLYGAASAIAGLYTGVADLVISREIWPIESLAFEQVLGYKPTAIEVATGSFDVPTKSDSLDIFVHRDNPISHLTMAQLAAIFCSDRARVWGDVGLAGDWARRPITTYGYKLDNAGMLLFADLVKQGIARWNPGIRDFGNAAGPNGKRIDAGTLMLEALAKDSNGIAICNAHYARPELKMLSIAAQEGGPYVLPGRNTVAARTYPLTRRLYIFLNQAPGHARDARAGAFVDYVLSREGQQDVAAEGDYLPMPPGPR